MDVPDGNQWIRLLNAVAAGALGVPPRGLAPWFQYARGLRPAPENAPHDPDDLLWLAVARKSEPVMELLERSGTTPAPLFPFSGDDTIEIWTERDLSAMHALSRLPCAPEDPWRNALDLAARWHLEHTQPDNATGRPWAIHVFVQRWVTQGEVESRLYAETLLHNCQMQVGSADPLSAEILRDAAEALAANEKI